MLDLLDAAGAKRHLLLHRRARAGASRAGARDRAARPQRAEPQHSAIRTLFLAAGDRAAFEREIEAAQAIFAAVCGTRPTLFPRARRPAQRLPVAGVAPPWPCAGELDAARLRHPRERPGPRAGAPDPGLGRRRHPAAARRPCGAHRLGSPGRALRAARPAGRAAARPACGRSPCPRRSRLEARQHAQHHEHSQPGTTPAWQDLREAASAPYRKAGRFAWHFARGKLGIDPVFRHVVCAGLIPPGARVLDLGCGQGLLASLLLAAGARHATPAGRGHPTGPPAPRDLSITGIELDAARRSNGPASRWATSARLRLRRHVRQADYPACDAVVILDVLHYLDPEDQDSVLRARTRCAGARGAAAAACGRCTPARSAMR